VPRFLRCINPGMIALLVAAMSTLAHAAEITAHVQVRKDSSAQHKHKPAEVVLWLSPMQLGISAAAPVHAGPFRLVQKDKMFTPHLLVVPTGSSVDFPNLDPFFHNVFSLFNGKRFDLGLYASGASRAVRFDREGVSYIFCNIHPEMGAIVLALSTPYYAISTAQGEIAIHNVPPGSYRLHLWSEAAHPADPERIIQVGNAPVNLGEIELQAAPDPIDHHRNKFGDDYHPDHAPAY
jgi:plastocyanin